MSNQETNHEPLAKDRWAALGRLMWIYRAPDIFPYSATVSSGNDHGDRTRDSRRIREAGMDSGEDLCGEA